MLGTWGRKILTVALGIGIFWLFVRFALPVAIPFLVGALLALAAEPMVAFCVRKTHVPRYIASGVGVTSVLVALVTLLWLLGAVLLRELGTLAKSLPDIQQTARDGILLAQDQLVQLSYMAPEGVRPLLTDMVLRFFSDGTAVMDRVTNRMGDILGALITAVPDGALGVGTGILASFMISSRLPMLRESIARHIPPKWKNTYIPAFCRIRGTLGGWLKAQLILCLVTYGIVTVGFFFMGIPFAPAWAALVAIVDAIPLLGTGTVLIPCAVVCFFQGNSLFAVFYLIIYGISAMVRAALEPRLVGKHLGIDPLATLIAIYAGYRFFGFLGLVFAPIVLSAVMQIINAEKM